MRKCKSCGRSERQTYISNRYLCKRCAVERARAQAERTFDMARRLDKRTDDSLAGGMARMIAYMDAVHTDAVKRHEKQKAKLRG